MTPVEVAARVGELLGPDVRTADAYGEAVADLPRASWVDAVVAVRDDPALDLRLFDLLTAVDEEPHGLDVVLRGVRPTVKPLTPDTAVLAFPSGRAQVRLDPARSRGLLRVGLEVQGATDAGERTLQLPELDGAVRVVAVRRERCR